MRSLHLIAALPLLALTACGGASGPESVGSVAPPAGSTGGSGGTGTGVTPTPSPAPTPTPTGGSGTGVTPAPTPTPTPAPTPTHFLSVSAAKTFDAIGSLHSNAVDEATQAVLYQGNASTVRSPTGSVTYDPRDGTFSINFVDTKAGVNTANFRYQDPAHRTEPTLRYATPEYGVPAFNNFNYLQAIGPQSAVDVIDRITFFYQRPGSSTYYVSLAGYVHNVFTNPSSANAPTSTSTYERGALVFGDQTARAQIPVSGTGSYKGGMIASMITGQNNFQWIEGSSDLSFDFGKATMTMLLTGTLNASYIKGDPVPEASLRFPTGSVFNASASGTIDLVRNGGFTGQFNSVSFTSGSTNTVVYDRVNPVSSTAGANSIDGAFFGPNAVNVGGNFRIVGGVPNERLDILGAFTGAKQ